MYTTVLSYVYRDVTNNTPKQTLKTVEAGSVISCAPGKQQ